MGVIKAESGKLKRKKKYGKKKDDAGDGKNGKSVNPANEKRKNH